MKISRACHVLVHAVPKTYTSAKAVYFPKTHYHISPSTNHMNRAGHLNFSTLFM